MATEKTVLKFFRLKTDISNLTKDEILKINYLDAGMLDSLSFIEMVVYLESRLDVKLAGEDLLSEEAQTIGGLIDLINRVKFPTGIYRNRG